MDVTLGLAFFAGLLSFVSPCVLPLVPAYIGYMSGRVTQTVSTQVSVSSQGQAVASGPPLSARFSTLMHGAAFVIGFTLVFVLVGLALTAFVQQIGGANVSVLINAIGRLGGVTIILFGLHFMGVLPSLFNWLRRPRDGAVNAALVAVFAVIGVSVLLWGFTGQIDVWNTDLWQRAGWAPALGIITSLIFLALLVVGGAVQSPGRFLTRLTNTFDQALYADTRPEMNATGTNGLLGSALMGVVFSAGWTPCVGPIYGAILNMSVAGEVTQATPLLIAYSLGLGIPFLLSALMLDGAQGFLRRLNRHMRTIKLVSGAFLIFIGVVIASGQLQALSQDWSVRFGDFSLRLEECGIGWVEGDIAFGQLGDCVGGAASFEALREANLSPSQASLSIVENTSG
jgi:cytochrome c-type biogenesis protein